MTIPWLLITFALVWLAALTWFLLALARELGIVLSRLGPERPMVTTEGPAVGSKLESRLAYEEGYVDVFQPGRLTLWVFLSPACSICRGIQTALPTFMASYSSQVRLILVYDRPPDDLEKDFAESATILHSPILHSRFGLEGTPYAVVVDDVGIVTAKGVVNNLGQLESLIGIELFAIKRDSLRRLLEV